MRARWGGRQGGWQAALALAAANLLLLVLLVRPAWEAGRTQEDRILDLQRRIRAVQRESQSGEAMLAAQRQVEEFARGYPARSELVSLIGRLTAAARHHGLEAKAVEYRPSEITEAGLTKVTLALGLEGSYAKIRRLLYELEGLRRYLVIERVALRDPKGTAELQVQLQLALYLR